MTWSAGIFAGMMVLFFTVRFSDNVQPRQINASLILLALLIKIFLAYLAPLQRNASPDSSRSEEAPAKPSKPVVGNASVCENI